MMIGSFLSHRGALVTAKVDVCIQLGHKSLSEDSKDKLKGNME